MITMETSVKVVFDVLAPSFTYDGAKIIKKKLDFHEKNCSIKC